MKRFGFNSKPQIDLPRTSSRRAASQLERRPGRPRHADRRRPRGDRPGAARGRLATPLQMAEVAATVANGGELMRPQLWEQVVDPDGRVVKR